MPDLKDRILEIIQKPQLAVLATVTGEGKPWARYVMTVADEDLTIRFASFVSARKVQQIRENPEVHLTCGATGLETIAPYLQIQGRAELSVEKAERDGFWTEELGEIFAGPDDPNYGVVLVTPYRIEYCTHATFEPEVWEAQT